MRCVGLHVGLSGGTRPDAVRPGEGPVSYGKGAYLAREEVVRDNDCGCVPRGL